MMKPSLLSEARDILFKKKKFPLLYLTVMYFQEKSLSLRYSTVNVLRSFGGGGGLGGGGGGLFIK